MSFERGGGAVDEGGARRARARVEPEGDVEVLFLSPTPIIIVRVSHITG